MIERGEVANTWRTERWDSLRLLTPNWQSRLPGLEYDGDDPDGYMTMPEVIEFIDTYANTSTPPPYAPTPPSLASAHHDGYESSPMTGAWSAPTVVLATGGFNLASIPAIAGAVPVRRDHHRHDYRRPELLPTAALLVVGASATGIQIAEEVQRSGRPVTLAVGEHVRLPGCTEGGTSCGGWTSGPRRALRRGRRPGPGSQHPISAVGRDTGAKDARSQRARPTRGCDGRSRGGIVDGTAQLSGSLRNLCNLADLKMDRLLGTIDDWALAEWPWRARSRTSSIRPDPSRGVATLSLDLADGGISTVIWATGFRPDYSWLHARVLDRKGRPRHDGGVVTEAPGLYRIGLNMLRRRKSSFIHGAEDDARDLTDHLAAYVGVGVSV